MGADRATIGWREWVALPGLGIDHVKAKIDTGARTSSLHAVRLEFVSRGGIETVRYEVHPFQRHAGGTVRVENPLLERRVVRSSSGHESERPVILTDVVLLGLRFRIELTLVAREDMGFRMLLGREAIRGRFLVDPGRSFVDREARREGRASSRKLSPGRKTKTQAKKKSPKSSPESAP